jgi:hypothetical protein
MPQEIVGQRRAGGRVGARRKKSRTVREAVDRDLLTQMPAGITHVGGGDYRVKSDVALYAETH